jgi:hypothetical protein
VSEKRGLKGIFRIKRNEVRGGWGKPHRDDIFLPKNCYNIQIKSIRREGRVACIVGNVYLSGRKTLRKDAPRKTG